MSEQTLDAPPIEVPAGPPGGERRDATRPDLADLAYRYRWVLTAVGLLLLSLVIVLYARARPGYDPYGWLVWGKLTIHLNLDTNGAPSWKPLPFLFTVPYALVGHYALWLWMVTSVAISLSGLIFAWRIAFRLTYSRPERRYASYVAGLFAAAFVLGMQDPIAHCELRPLHPQRRVRHDDRGPVPGSRSTSTWRSITAGRSGCGSSRGLGRPEVWPFLGLAGLWLWWKDPSYRRWLYGALGLVLVFWFVIPGDQLQELLHRGKHRPELPARRSTATRSRARSAASTSWRQIRCGSWRC